MQFSKTATKDGIIQNCEFWTNLGDTGISGNATLLAQFTNRINRRLERAMARMGALSSRALGDDTNFDNHSFSTFSISFGTHAYQFLTTEDGETITDITSVLILPSASATAYVPLDKLTLDNSQADLILSPNASNTGVPTGYIERNNTVFFDTIPNYDATGKVFFKRTPSYFTTSDTTKEPGFSAYHHEILPLGASLDWLLVNKAEAVTLITRVEVELARAESEFEDYIRMRAPIRSSLTPAIDSSE